MTDRELLELAAKVAGINLVCDEGEFMSSSDDGLRFWNPLESDGDALRLAVKLQIATDFTSNGIYAGQNPDSDESDWCHEFNNGDPYAATRRAIVRASAAIGEQI